MSRHWNYREAAATAVTPAEADVLARLPGVSTMAQDLRRWAAVVASLPDAILICGPIGSGRTHLAETLHSLSRRNGALARLASVDADDRSAMTAACDAAGQGTLVIENIETLSHLAQEKLATLIDRAEEIGLRVIVTARGTLAELATVLLADLYQRLAAFALELPSLDQRREDLPAIAEKMLAAMAAPVTLDQSAHAFLAAREWSGNLRELRNLLRRASSFFAGKTLGAEHFGAAPVTQVTTCQPTATKGVDEIRTGKAIDLRGHLRDIEVELIHAALSQENNHVAKAAEILGLGRTTLIEKMRKNGIRYQIG